MEGFQRYDKKGLKETEDKKILYCISLFHNLINYNVSTITICLYRKSLTNSMFNCNLQTYTIDQYIIEHLYFGLFLMHFIFIGSYSLRVRLQPIIQIHQTTGTIKIILVNSHQSSMCSTAFDVHISYVIS